MCVFIVSAWNAQDWADALRQIGRPILFPAKLEALQSQLQSQKAPQPPPKPQTPKPLNLLSPKPLNPKPLNRKWFPSGLSGVSRDPPGPVLVSSVYFRLRPVGPVMFANLKP